MPGEALGPGFFVTVTLAKKVIQALVLLHHLDQSVELIHLFLRALKVPCNLVKGQDCQLLLMAAPRCAFHKVLHHLELG